MALHISNTKQYLIDLCEDSQLNYHTPTCTTGCFFDSNTFVLTRVTDAITLLFVLSRCYDEFRPITVGVCDIVIYVYSLGSQNKHLNTNFVLTGITDPNTLDLFWFITLLLINYNEFF